MTGQGLQKTVEPARVPVALLSLLSVLAVPEEARVLAAEPAAPASQNSQESGIKLKSAQYRLEFLSQAGNLVFSVNGSIGAYQSAPGNETMARMALFLKSAEAQYPLIAEYTGLADSGTLKSLLREINLAVKDNDYLVLNALLGKLKNTFPVTPGALDREVSTLEKGIAVAWIAETRERAKKVKEGLRPAENGWLADASALKELVNSVEESRLIKFSAPAIFEMQQECRRAVMIIEPRPLVGPVRVTAVSENTAFSLETIESYLGSCLSDIDPEGKSFQNEMVYRSSPPERKSREILTPNAGRNEDGNIEIKAGDKGAAGIINELGLLLKLRGDIRIEKIEPVESRGKIEKIIVVTRGH